MDGGEEAAVEEVMVDIGEIEGEVEAGEVLEEGGGDEVVVD